MNTTTMTVLLVIVCLVIVLMAVAYLLGLVHVLEIPARTCWLWTIGRWQWVCKQRTV